MAMAKGAKIISGSFTVPSSGSSYILSLGESLERYIFLIEATNYSKTQIMQSGIDGAKSYAFIGIYPKLSIDSIDANFSGIYAKINPSTEASSNTSATNVNPGDNKIYFSINTLANGSSVLFKGLSYNYTIVEI